MGQLQLHMWQHVASTNLLYDNKCHHPSSAQFLSNDFYVDDLLSGTTTHEGAFNLQQELTSLLNTVGITLIKWASNHPPFLEIIPTELKKTK